MHILIFPSWYPNHDQDLSGHFFVEQARALEKAGHKVTIAYVETRSLTRIFRDRLRQSWAPGFRKETQHLIEYRYRIYNWLMKIPYGKEWLVYRKLKKMTDMIRTERGEPDLIHLHSFLSHGLGAVKLSRTWKVPLVVTEHYSGIARRALKAYQDRIIKMIGNQAVKILSVGSGVGEYYKEMTGRDVLTVPNMVDVDHFMPHYSEDKKTLKIVALGHLSYRKGFDLIVNAFPEVLQHYPDAELVIAGEGKGRQELERQITSLERTNPEVKNRILLPGPLFRKDVPEFLNSASLFVLASRDEPFGVVVIEALAMGLPVVATANEGPVSILDETCGILVENDDPQALSTGILYALDHINEYDPVKIRAYCIEHYSEEAVTAKLNSIYEEAIHEYK